MESSLLRHDKYGDLIEFATKLARKKGFDGQDADEIAGEAILRIVKLKIHLSPEARFILPKWVDFMALEFVRRKGRLRTESAFGRPGPDESGEIRRIEQQEGAFRSPSSMVHEHERRAFFASFASILPEPEKQLHLLDEDTSKSTRKPGREEIAKSIGCDVKTVTDRRNRIRAKKLIYEMIMHGRTREEVIDRIIEIAKKKKLATSYQFWETVYENILEFVRRSATENGDADEQQPNN